MKTLHNSSSDTAQKNVPDLKLWGNPDTWKLICKASSSKEGWMKSTKAMEILGVGCLVQVTTQQRTAGTMCALKRDENGNPILGATNGLQYDYSEVDENYSLAEAITFVPGVGILETFDDDKKVISRKLVSFWEIENIQKKEDKTANQ